MLLSRMSLRHFTIRSNLEIPNIKCILRSCYSHKTPKQKEDLRKSINNQTDVALTLTRHILTTEFKLSNVVFSPVSIQVLISLVAAGSKGPTQEQIVSFLKSTSSDQLTSLSSEIVGVVFSDASESGGPRLSFANAAWVDKSLTLKISFKQILDTSFKAQSNQLDFQTKAVEARNEVNAWADKATNGLIKDVLPEGSIDNTTRFVLANALYFKGDWNEKFDSSTTDEQDFYLLDGSTVRVPFMTSEKNQYVSAFDGFKVLGLYYRQGRDRRQFSMYFFLPDAKDGLPALVEKLGSGSGFLDRHLPRHKVELGDFKIPKFKFSFRLEASNALKELGLTLPFTKGDLTEMVDTSEGRNLYVSCIYHKAFIEVNEKGTEAAAASATAMRVGSSMRFSEKIKKINFVADHPFLFVIREEMTGVVLFIGQVLQPMAN